MGVRINVDVLNAQQQLFTTRRDLSKARYDTIIAGLKLKASTGTLKEDDIEMINGLLSEPVVLVVPPVPAPPPARSGTPAAVSKPAVSAPTPAPASASDAKPGMRPPAASEQRGGRSRKPMAPRER